MRNLDFTPLYRTSVGFDHLSSLLDAVSRNDSSAGGYPPYNIELLEKDNYMITMAVAGFTDDELEIHAEQETLIVKGQRNTDSGKHNYLHQGIAARNFERRFQLAEHVKVIGARLEHGLLHIDLVREIPEAMKPKRIPIGSGGNRLIDVNKDRDAA